MRLLSSFPSVGRELVAFGAEVQGFIVALGTVYNFSTELNAYFVVIFVLDMMVMRHYV